MIAALIGVAAIAVVVAFFCWRVLWRWHRERRRHRGHLQWLHREVDQACCDPVLVEQARRQIRSRRG